LLEEFLVDGVWSGGVSFPCTLFFGGDYQFAGGILTAFIVLCIASINAKNIRSLGGICDAFGA